MTMKEITRISLAALPYNIEVDAKKQLEKYLSAIKHSLDADPDTMKEIESRMVELLADRGVSGENVISSDDVTAITDTLGEPKEFIDGTETAAVESSKKQLMRDPANEMVGGVSSGIAAYFRIDTVWVRLAWVLLAFATSGFMILVYLVLWVVMPPAKTAAERLRMKGEAVTPTTLQAESEIMLKKDISEKRARIVFRILGAATAAGIGLFAAIGMAVVGWRAWGDGWAKTMPQWWWLYGGLIVLAGVLFVLFCCLIAYMLFVGKATKRLVVSLGVITALGIISFGAGATLMSFGIRAEETKSQAEMIKNAKRSTIDASQVKKAKRIELKSELPITVNYNVDPAHTEATIWYNTSITKSDPKVALTTTPDGTLSINVPIADSQCLPDVTRCRMQTVVTIVGPELESMYAQGSNLVHYIVNKQEKLSVSTRADGRIELQTVGTIKQLTATLSNESRIDTLQAGIEYIDLTIEDALSNADIATVDTLAITVPTACATNHGGGTIHVTRAREITVNGKAYDTKFDYPCTTIKAENL